jgi:hypothetical protein
MTHVVYSLEFVVKPDGNSKSRVSLNIPARNLAVAHAQQARNPWSIVNRRRNHMVRPPAIRP